MKRAGWITLKTGIFIAVPGMIAWMTGSLFIFPSLGPTAYILAFDSRYSYRPSVVIGGHSCGVIGGIISYYLLVNPYHLLELGAAFSPAGASLAIGSVTALALTSFLMLWFQASHPPACATTLIVSLGIMPKPEQGLLILLAVTVQFLTYWLFFRLENRGFNNGGGQTTEE